MWFFVTLYYYYCLLLYFHALNVIRLVEKNQAPQKNNLQFSTLFDESSPPQTQIQCKQYKNSKYYYILLLLLLEQLFVWHYILHGVLHIIHRQWHYKQKFRTLSRSSRSKTVNFNSNHDDDEHEKKRSLKKRTWRWKTQQLNNHKY